MKRSPKPAVKPDMVSLNVWCSRAFREAIGRKAKEEDRDASKLVRRVLRERYPDLPED